jgi:hypothetical protein
MAATENLFKGSLWTGLAVGAAVVVLGPVLLPALARVGKPAAKTALKAGVVLYDRGRETAARMAELAEDVFAEVRAEMAAEANEAGMASAAAGAAAESSGPGDAETEAEAHPT